MKILSSRDIYAFLKSELSEFRYEYNISVPKNRQISSDWPGETNPQILVKMAIPLFIFAATVSRSLRDWRQGRHPDKKLVDILKYETRSQTSKLDATYYPILGQLLIDLSELDRDDRVRDFRQIVGPIIVLASPLSTASLSRLLTIPKLDIDSELDLLHSVLDIPFDGDTDAPVKLLHLSFRDFLVDPKKREKRETNRFWIDEEKTHERLLEKCLKLLSEGEYHLRKYFYAQQIPGSRLTDIDKQNILDHLPPEVQYACLYWVYHFKGSQRRVQDGDEIHQFLERHLLHWIETLSLIRRVSESIGMIGELQSMTDVSNLVILYL